MNVRVLYIECCPNHAPVVDLFKSVVQETGVDARVEEVEVRNQAEAERFRFLGSPTIQVDGVDIEPKARRRQDFSYSCRMYGTSGRPSRELMKAALMNGDQKAKPNATLYASGGTMAAAIDERSPADGALVNAVEKSRLHVTKIN